MRSLLTKRNYIALGAMSAVVALFFVMNDPVAVQKKDGQDDESPRSRELVSDAADICVQGYNGDDLTTVQPYKKPMKKIIPMHMCGEFDELSCCSNVMAQEITDGFEHLMDIGGSGGVPVDDGRCYQYAKEKFIALKDYFCLFCNPRQVKYLACCNDQYKVGGDCTAGEDTKVTDEQLMTVYGKGTCTGKAADTIRICRRFADELWGDDNGAKYDSCGMMHWVLNGETAADENAWSDQGHTGNPNGIMPWGDVDGRSGDDPITPSEFYSSVEKFFHDVRPPLFDQFRVAVVDDSAGDCFDGYVKRGGATTRRSHMVISVTALVVSLIWWF